MKLKKNIDWQDVEFKMEWMYDRRDIDYFIDDLFDDAFVSNNDTMIEFIIADFPEYMRIIEENHRITPSMRYDILDKISQSNMKDPSEMIEFYRRIFEFSISRNELMFIQTIVKKYPILIDTIENPGQKILDLKPDYTKLENDSGFSVDLSSYHILDAEASWVYSECYNSPDRLLEYIHSFVRQGHFNGDYDLLIRVAIARTGMLKDKPWYDSVVNDTLITMLKLEYI